MNDKRRWYIYVLELEDNNWYVGITTNVDRRYTNHATGIGGAKWTRRHQPVRIHDSKELGYMSTSEAEKKESYITYLYVVKYGIQNVRGGFFCGTKLTDKYWSKTAKKFNNRYHKKGYGASVPYPAGSPIKKKRKAKLVGSALARAELAKNARLFGVYA